MFSILNFSVKHEIFMKLEMEVTDSSTYKIYLPFYDMKMDQIKKKALTSFKIKKSINHVVLSYNLCGNY